jgi:heme/copper-type cytochrome/quinol oxidase subunit 2
MELQLLMMMVMMMMIIIIIIIIIIIQLLLFICRINSYKANYRYSKNIADTGNHIMDKHKIIIIIIISSFTTLLGNSELIHK